MNISILEDDVFMANNIAKKLKNNWYKVNIYNSVNDFTLKHNNNSDLYIFDLSLWDWDGFKVIKRLREKRKNYTPIIIISSYSDTEKKVYWLDLWADDYLTKPFAPDELLARIRRILMRKNFLSTPTKIKHWEIDFDLKSKEVFLRWKNIHFTKKEKLIIELFLLNKWELVEKTKLINTIWWDDDSLLTSDNTINVTISRVRAKLWKNFNLKTIINEWYILY